MSDVERTVARAVFLEELARKLRRAGENRQADGWEAVAAELFDSAARRAMRDTPGGPHVPQQPDGGE